MTDEQKAAVINARCVTAMIRAMGMAAANSQHPQYQPHPESDFQAVINEEGVSWNDIHKVLFD